MDAIKILGSLLSSGALSKGSGGNVLGNILGSALGGSQNQQTRSGGSLGDILGSVLGGGSSSQSSGGGLGDILGSLIGGGSSSQSSGGGLGNILGSLVGGSSNGGGGLNDLLKGSLGGLLGGAVAKHVQTVDPDAPTPMPDDYNMLPADLEPKQANDEATLIIKAMINAAKSDGKFDEAEQQALVKKLGNITQEEMEFIQNEFNKPLDVQGFANEVPRGMEHQIYALSLSAIDLDSQSEAKYLAQLAQALRITPAEANQIHEQLGAPKIFS
jgi:uncharacterized membrane protein YebE (DUF533 family)